MISGRVIAHFRWLLHFCVPGAGLLEPTISSRTAALCYLFVDERDSQVKGSLNRLSTAPPTHESPRIGCQKKKLQFVERLTPICSDVDRPTAAYNDVGIGRNPRQQPPHLVLTTSSEQSELFTAKEGPAALTVRQLAEAKGSDEGRSSFPPNYNKTCHQKQSLRRVLLALASGRRQKSNPLLMIGRHTHVRTTHAARQKNVIK